MEKLNEIYARLVSLAAQFEKEHKAAVEGNKSAARRARVLSVRLREVLKEYRQLSNEIF